MFLYYTAIWIKKVYNQLIWGEIYTLFKGLLVCDMLLGGGGGGGGGWGGDLFKASNQ